MFTVPCRVREFSLCSSPDDPMSRCPDPPILSLRAPLCPCGKGVSRRASFSTDPPGGSARLRILFIGQLTESFAVAFFDAAYGPQQMVIGSGAEFFRLAVQDLHHQRIENAGLLQ